MSNKISFHQNKVSNEKNWITKGKVEIGSRTQHLTDGALGSHLGMAGSRRRKGKRKAAGGGEGGSKTDSKGEVPIDSTERRAVWALSFVEVFLSQWEYLFGWTFFMKMAMDGLEGTPYASALATVVSSLAIVVWFLTRFSWTTNISMRETLRRMGFDRPRFSSYLLVVLLLHVSSTLIMALSQPSGGPGVRLTTDNFRDANGEFDAGRAIDLLVLAPLREELLYRGVLFSLVYRRLASVSAGWQGPIVVSSLAFGLMHGMNFFSNRGPSKLYVLLQVLDAVPIGVFYNLRFISTGNIWETIGLHFIHNVFASLVPTKLEYRITDPYFVVPALATLLVHLLLARNAYRSLERQSGGAKFRVVDAKTEKAPRLAAFLERDEDGQSEGKALVPLQ